MTDITQAPYNLSKLMNSTSLGNLLTNIAPTMHGYYLGMAFLIIIFLVSFLYLIGMGRFLTRSCVMGALSLTMLSSIFLFTMGMVGAGMMWFVIFAWIGTLFILALFFEDG